jgi:PAS domain S-box-containing protein
MNNARNYLLLLAIIGSLGIALFTVIQARRIVIPLQLLVKGTQQVGRGNLNVTIPVTSSDEIGHLSRAFNAMSHDLSTSLTALKQSEKYFRALTENSSDLITLLTPDGNIRYLSPSITGLLGYRSRGLMGQPLSSIMDTDSSPKFDRFLIRLQQSENETLSEEFVFLNRAEEARIFEISARNLTSVPGVGGLVLNSRDITTRKQIEDELKTSELQLHHLSSQLISAQEDERKRLSVELHDEVGQSLAVLKLKIIFFEESLDSGDQSGKKECEAMVAFIDQLIENVRRLSHDLAPTAIEDLGLSAALMWLIDTIKKHYTITTDISLGELDNLLSLDRQILVYRIFQEAIANAVKHANATRLIMTGRLESNALFFKIEDNGKGFVRNQTDPDSREKTGIGIATMQERVRMLGGNLVIKSAEGSGAVLQFNIPVDTSRSHGHL